METSRSLFDLDRTSGTWLRIRLDPPLRFLVPGITMIPAAIVFSASHVRVPRGLVLETHHEVARLAGNLWVPRLDLVQLAVPAIWIETPAKVWIL